MLRGHHAVLSPMINVLNVDAADIGKALYYNLGRLIVDRREIILLIDIRDTIDQGIEVDQGTEEEDTAKANHDQEAIAETEKKEIIEGVTVEAEVEIVNEAEAGAARGRSNYMNEEMIMTFNGSSFEIL